MKVIHADKNKEVLIFEMGEEVISALKDYCAREKIKAADIRGIGACSRAVLSFYDLDRKEYRDKEFSRSLEVVTLLGNAALKEGIAILHLHGIFSDENYNAFGGHVKELTVSGTCEITMDILDVKLMREYDERTGLNLIK